MDVAQQAGLNIPNVWGGIDHKRSIIETKGSGLAFFDYDNDGWLDIYLTNGNRLDATLATRERPPPRIFTRTTATARLPMSRRSRVWGLQAGRQASALETTTTTDGTTCSAASGA